MADYVEVRDRAVTLGQLAQAVSVEDLVGAIEHAERAQAVGPILDPTAFLRGSDELDKQITYLRAVLAFRRAVDATMSGSAV